MKKLLVLLLILTLSITMIAGCRKKDDGKIVIGVTIYKYDDYFMSFIRKAIEKNAKDSIELILNDSHRERFAREARSVALLNHPNIVQIYSYGVTEKNVPYIAMEYLEGKTLQAVLKTEAPLHKKRFQEASASPPQVSRPTFWMLALKTEAVWRLSPIIFRCVA